VSGKYRQMFVMEFIDKFYKKILNENQSGK